MKTLRILLTVVLVAAASGARLSGQSPNDLYQKALAAERADGNLREAIRLYERAVAQARNDRALIARALLRIADCYERLGQADALAAYQRVVRDFSDQPDSASIARARLEALQSTQAAPAATPVLRQVWGPGSDPMGSPSPDGRYLSFTDWETGDLAIRDLRAGTNRRLTATAGWEASGDFAEYSVISPDGRQVAYAWFNDRMGKPEGPCRCRYDLRVLPVAATTPPRPQVIFDAQDLYWVRPVGWTPDSRSVVFVWETADRAAHLAVVTAAGGTARQLKTFPWPGPSEARLSPDGRYLAYDAPADPRTARHDIFVLALDGSVDAPLISDAAHDAHPIWSSDGTLLFISDRTGADALWRAPVRDGRLVTEPTLVRTDLGTGAIPLGLTRAGALFFTRGGPIANVYMAGADQSLATIAPPNLLTTRFMNFNQAPSWSADGERMAYLSRRGSSDAPGSTSLVVRTIATGEEREVPLKIPLIDRVSWFPDGRHVLAASRDTQQPRLAFSRIDLETGAAEVVHYNERLGGQTARRPEVSPDGASFFYVEANTPAFNSSRLMRFDFSTRTAATLKVVTGPDTYFTSFAVSPDGADVAYLLFDGRTRTTALEVMPSTGGPARTVLPAATSGGMRYSGLAWTPDKRYILFVKPDGAEGATVPTSLWRVSSDGGEPQKTSIVTKGQLRLPTVQPRGGRISYGVHTPADRDIWALENFLPATSAKR